MLTNRGISFGIEFAGVWVLELVVLGWLVRFWWRRRYWGLGLMIIGGVLNLAERLVWGYVSDYWKIPGLNLYNNLNDWLIFGGAIIFIGENIWKRRSK